MSVTALPIGVLLKFFLGQLRANWDLLIALTWQTDKMSTELTLSHIVLTDLQEIQRQKLTLFTQVKELVPKALQIGILALV